MSVHIPEYCSRPILVLGCGNVLFGDDGFGPAVAQSLETRRDLPEEVCVMDAGTSVREILFDVILSETRPRKIIIVDAMDRGRQPGELFQPSMDSVPLHKLDDFSMHQLPTSNLLYELRELGGVEVELIACQVENVPESVSPGLCAPVRAAVARATEAIIRKARSWIGKVSRPLKCPGTHRSFAESGKATGVENGTGRRDDRKDHRGRGA